MRWNDHHFRQQVTFNHTSTQWALSTFHPQTAECIFDLSVICLGLPLLLCASVHSHHPVTLCCFHSSMFCTFIILFLQSFWVNRKVSPRRVLVNASVGIDSCWNTCLPKVFYCINSLSVVPPEKMLELLYALHWKVWPQRSPLVKQQPVAATDKWGYGHFACLICVYKLHLMNRTPKLNDCWPLVLTSCVINALQRPFSAHLRPQVKTSLLRFVFRPNLGELLTASLPCRWYLMHVENPLLRSPFIQ